MGTQLIDAAVSNNKSFKNLIDLQNSSKASSDPEDIFEKMRQLELEIEETRRKKQEDESANDEEEKDEIRYEDIPIIPTVKLVLPSPAVVDSDFIQMKIDDESRQPEEKDLKDSSSCDKLSKMIKEIADIKTNINANFNSINTTRASDLPSIEVDAINTDGDYRKSDNLDLNKATMSASLSNNSLASTLTNMSAKPEFSMETLPKWLVMDAHVIVSTNSIQNKRGHVRFIGATKFAHGTWIGVELEQAFGKNDGSLKGIRYFRCGEDKGCFVRADKLSLVVNKI